MIKKTAIRRHIDNIITLRVYGGLKLNKDYYWVQSGLEPTNEAQETHLDISGVNSISNNSISLFVANKEIELFSKLATFQWAGAVSTDPIKGLRVCP